MKMLSDRALPDHTLPEAFLPLTEELEALLSTIPHSTGRLYGWLYRQAKPGTQIEICLDHFVEESGCCLKSVQRGIVKLADLKLITIVKKYSARWYKVTANKFPR